MRFQITETTTSTRIATVEAADSAEAMRLYRQGVELLPESDEVRVSVFQKLPILKATGIAGFNPDLNQVSEALFRPWESRLDALYQAATPPPDMYRHWFGEVGQDASDTMRKIARQNGSLKLHEVLIARLQGDEWPAEMRALQSWSDKASPQGGSNGSPDEGTVSQAHQSGSGDRQSRNLPYPDDTETQVSGFQPA